MDRQARGRALAEAEGPRIRCIEGDVWYVPSSSQAGGYLVIDGRCSCPDETERCKHVVAVEIVKGAMVKSDGAQMPISFPPTPPKVKQPRGDLTIEEQKHVREALKFLRAKSGGWDAVSKGTRFTIHSLKHVAYGRQPGASLAVRLARFAGVGVDDLLCGKYPPLCLACGQRMPATGAASYPIPLADSNPQG